MLHDVNWEIVIKSRDKGTTNFGKGRQEERFLPCPLTFLPVSFVIPQRILTFAATLEVLC